MPELPEVETVVRDLRPQLAGRRIQSVELTRDRAVLGRVLRYPKSRRAFVDRLSGRRIEGVERRGKYIVMPLDRPLPDRAEERLIVHLGMTGHLRVFEPEEPARPHTHLRVSLESGLELRFDDPRQFGRLLLGTEPELLLAGALPRLGPEPLAAELTADDFSRLVRGRRRPVKSALLDQSFLAGVGNIYADEACFVAGVRPGRRTDRLTLRERGALYSAIQQVLRKSISARGSSVINYVDAFGVPGGNQENLLVYGRGGEPCLRCGTTLSTTRLSGRTTVYCRRCQR
ncbi:MAG TPA: bifunctional DNA-formamidopyrimidine glycosylase/DNA-(apurinic or apyrimidinic site) lyase [Candidatus Limnocylindrales bacterium]|nr:bifunctional DNA-formamidopyrimidine glycosylase/DNA-(apurinic or apyrimidinic site) lyase [Candidatus Limnocylindrales bacterium]